MKFKIFCILFIIIIIFLITFPAKSQSVSEPVYIEHEVSQGETLWSISSKYCLEDMDKREWIYEVSKRNDCRDKMIYPGDVLLIQVEGDV